ncbi:hypothetical protein CROQUDRAFT_133627 [Cronartium quercuum f. sp. fusiforme G11]|uniref:Uncharacterized protein n=1 Tax=Cronartium quercuum f. sp. fusiforme G11 TaxID=708437 RepID=A0A9P6NK50_9BASI|nr:hypothetical protein CROQUDRAFT_133627 [Cronartium quercuum f. sp. fusiforme G11]
MKSIMIIRILILCIFSSTLAKIEELEKDLVQLNCHDIKLFEHHTTSHSLRFGKVHINLGKQLPKQNFIQDLDRTLIYPNKMVNVLTESEILKHKMEIFNSMNIEVDHLRKQEEKVMNSLSSSDPTAWSISEVEKMIPEVWIQETFLDQADKKIEFIKSEQVKYINKLTRTKLQNQTVLVLEALKDPVLTASLGKTRGSHHHPEVSRIFKMLELQPRSWTFWDFVKGVSNWLLRSQWGIQIEARTLALQWRQKRLTSTLTDLVQKAAVEELYMNALWRGGFYEDEHCLLNQLDYNPDQLSTDQRKLMKELYLSYMAHSIAPNAFIEAKNELIEGIERVGFDREDELQLFLLTDIKDVQQQQDLQKSEKKIHLNQRKMLVDRLGDHIKILERISQKRSGEENLNPEEIEFISLIFEDELNLMRKTILKLGIFPVDNSVPYDQFGIIPQGRKHSHHFYHHKRSPSGLFLSKLLTEEERALLDPLRQVTKIFDQKSLPNFTVNKNQRAMRTSKKTPKAMKSIPGRYHVSNKRLVFNNTLLNFRRPLTKVEWKLKMGHYSNRLSLEHKPELVETTLKRLFPNVSINQEISAICLKAQESHWVEKTQIANLL